MIMVPSLVSDSLHPAAPSLTADQFSPTHIHTQGRKQRLKSVPGLYRHCHSQRGTDSSSFQLEKFPQERALIGPDVVNTNSGVISCGHRATVHYIKDHGSCHWNYMKEGMGDVLKKFSGGWNAILGQKGKPNTDSPLFSDLE
jgi:hypothetical protein